PQTKTAHKIGMLARIAPPPPPPPTLSPGASEVRKDNFGSALQGLALKRVQPEYPPIAKAAKASGAVQVMITVNESGDVIDAKAVSGHPLLRDAALQAARQWQFKPTELSGKPVKVQGLLTFNFTLRDEDSSEPAMIHSGGRGLRASSNTEQLGTQMIEG